VTAKRKSIEQNPRTKLWHWYDETWNRSDTGYPTRGAARRVQNSYVRRVLEGGWAPSVGDYCWWIGNDHQIPVRIEGSVSDSLAWDWTIRPISNQYRTTCAYDYDLLPMVDMEVLAAAYADQSSAN
jgi:hypothetical protein